HRSKNLLVQGFLSGFCILFLPNSLYLISDFEHLKPRPPMPYFFDILLLFFAAFMGLVLTILSLENLRQNWKSVLGNKMVNCTTAVIIFLSGYGVYLGRYLRWNSWDIFTKPEALMRDCL